MSCYRPMIAIPTGERTTKGKKKYKFLQACNPDNDELPNLLHSGAILLPCGQCVGCRLDKSREWADRMMLELETSKKAIFLTLTYNNENLPYTESYFVGTDGEVKEGRRPTLVKKDLQDFIKRFRERKEFNGIRISYYGAGEYGDENLRPHYHIILFGVGVDDISDRVILRVTPQGYKYYISELIADIWSNGNILFTDVSWETCAYTARYVTKKLKGDDAIWYDFYKLTPPFAVMSLKPAIGFNYLKEHPDCLDLLKIHVSTKKDALEISIPKYFIRQLDNDRSDEEVNFYDHEKYLHLKALRKRFADDKMLLSLFDQQKQLEDYLKVQEHNHKKAMKILNKYRKKV